LLVIATGCAGVAGPTNLAALLTSFQLGFRSLALQKRSSEVWQLLGAIKTEFDRYGNVVNTLSRQLTTASNSVESLGRHTRAMSRKLKSVETLPNNKTAESLLGFLYKTIYWAMKHVSERSGHDMAAGRNVPVPKPDEMKSDLKAIDDYRINIDKRRKSTADVRAEYERAPKAATL
jgi:hypothetical protein